MSKMKQYSFMFFFWIIALTLYASWHGAWDEFYFAQEDSGVGFGGFVTNYTSGLDYQAHIYTNTAETNFVVSGGSLTVDLLMVAGGGGGGSWVPGGGGGGGGVILTNLNLSTGTYTVQVGEGGAVEVNGSNTIFHTLTAIGGGRGALFGSPPGDGGSGGGGEGYDFTGGGGGTTGQGNDGGDGGYDATYGYRGGGGGGYGSIGLSYTDARPNGGAGITNDFSGVEKGYGGGGGGGDLEGADQHGLGLDGGGDGVEGDFVKEATAGEDSTGGGGGGGSWSLEGAKGGSGIVIIRYVDD